jgi:hypothetical protein
MANNWLELYLVLNNYQLLTNGEIAYFIPFDVWFSGWSIVHYKYTAACQEINLWSHNMVHIYGAVVNFT